MIKMQWLKKMVNNLHILKILKPVRLLKRVLIYFIYFLVM
jgi:hypothetical protein